MEKTIKIKSSSSAEMYDVTLKNENGIFSLNCTCRAGIHKMICKHRVDLLNGDVSRLISEKDIQTAREFLDNIESGKVDSLFSELSVIEKEIEKLNKRKSKAKKDAGIRLSEGF